jgi:hypothetical protein
MTISIAVKNAYISESIFFRNSSHGREYDIPEQRKIVRQ